MDWDERYALYGRPFGREPNEFLEWAVAEGQFPPEQNRGERILCPGDGYGRNGIWLARRGDDVLGIDLSETATQDARSWAAETADAYAAITADLREVPYPLGDGQVFNGIVSIWFRLPQRSARQSWNRAATGHLRPGGQILLVAGPSVTTADEEIAEWPPSLSWSEHSTGDQIRLLGELVD